MPQTREAAIVGIHEYPLRVVGPGVSALQIKAASAARALEDAGLSWSDVDAVYDTGSHQSIGGLGISEYFGIKPKLIDNTAVGGTSYEFQANHAATMIAAGKCDVALLTYGSTAHSDRRAIGTGGAVGAGAANPQSNMEGVVGSDTHRQLCDGQEPPHAPVRHDQRAVRAHFGGHPQARDAKPGSGEGHDRPGVCRVCVNLPWRTSLTRG